MRKTIHLQNIILEGCDKTGKTSIAKKLIELCPTLKYLHFTAPKNYGDGQKQYIKLIKKLNNEHGLVCDRSWLGEGVYAPLMRGYTPDYLRNLEKSILNHNYLFLIIADENKVLKRFDGKFIIPAQINYVLSEFKKEFDNCNVQKKFVIDTTNDNISTCVNNILNYVRDDTS